MKAWTMLNKDIEDISFASKQFNPMIEEADISDCDSWDFDIDEVEDSDD